MTWTDTVVMLALWIGVCLVLFYGNYLVAIGVGLIIAAMNWISVDRVNAAEMEGFNQGAQSVKPRFFSEQATYTATFCYADGRTFQVRRDC